MNPSHKTTSHSSADQLVERVLRSLGETEAPTDLEHRIVDSLRRRAAVPVATHRTSAFFSRSVLWTAAVALLLAVGLAVVSLHTHPSSQQQAHTPVVPTTLTVIPIATTRTISPALHHRIHTTEYAGEPVPNSVHLDSFPAPPMPLTAQEKLLLRIIRSGETIELAELNSIARASQEAQEKTDFQNFFNPPTTGDKQ